MKLKLNKQKITRLLIIYFLIIISLQALGVNIDIYIILLGGALVLLLNFIFSKKKNLKSEKSPLDMTVNDPEEVKSTEKIGGLLIGTMNSENEPMSIQELVKDAKEKILTESEKSITQKVLEHLEAGKTITSEECMEMFDYDRLSAIIYKLKKRGLPITDMVIKKQIPPSKRLVSFKVYALVK